MTFARIAISLLVGSVGATAVLPPSAWAGPPEGAGIGPRLEGDIPGVGIDYWTPRLGITVTLGGSFSADSSETIDQSDGVAFDQADDDSYSLLGSVSVFSPLLSGKRARLSLGARFSVARGKSTFEDGLGESAQTSLFFRVPLRLQWFATDDIAFHTDVGFGVRRTSSTTDTITVFPDVEPFVFRRQVTRWTVEEFASPFANLGVTYFF